jgi:DNA-binding transcriptional LysR family regulator
VDLKGLKCFVAVAEQLHFGEAARRLNMLPSALSRQVRLLEEDLGVRLLVRSTRNVRLTEAGIVLFEEAQTILQRVAEAGQAVREAARGESRVLRIGAIDSAAAGYLPHFLSAFRHAYPEVGTELVESSSARQLQFLLSGRLDIGFVRPPVRIPGLLFEHLLDETLMVALPTDHPLAARSQIDIRELAAAPLILPPRRVRPHSFRFIMHMFDAAGTQPQVVQEASEKQTIVSLVAAGIGLALVPEWAAKLQVPGVVFRPIEAASPLAPPIEAALGAAWPTNQSCPPRDRFLKIVRKSLAEQGAVSR